MSTRIYFGAAVAATALIAIGTAAQAAPGDKIAGSYICVFKKGISNPRAEAARAAGANVHHVYSNSIRGFSAAMAASAVA